MGVTSLNLNQVPPTRVLFLCIGNSCRSQMAAGFARTYGSDVLSVQSAGLAPAMTVSSLTHQVMLERNIDIGQEFPKGLDMASPSDADLIINMSGHPLPGQTDVRIETWTVRDPIGESEEVYRDVRDQIEQRVMRLILKARATKPPVAMDDTVVDTPRRTPRQ
jgi:arsenate reductase (thioredoxin)